MFHGFQPWARTGEDLGIRHFGGRALNSLRLENSFGGWTREYTPDYTPFEAGLGRFVSLRKNAFIGRDAALEAKEAGSERRLVTLVVDADGVDAFGDEPIWLNGELAGWVTSGGYGHTVEQSIALGYVRGEAAEAGGTFEVEILGERRPANLAAGALCDPDGARMRS